MRIAIPHGLTAEATRPRPGRPIRLSGPTMGVSWTLLANAPLAVSDAALTAAVQGAANLVVKQMSTWEPESDISRFNAAPAGAWVEAPDHLLRVIRAALVMAQASDGAFDPTLGEAVDLWGFGAWGAALEPPRPERLAAAVSGWRALEIEGGRMRQPGGLRLDLSGVAKGYGVDLAAQAVAGLGVRDFLIEIGGELRGSGVRGDGEPWWVDLEHPAEAHLEEPPLRIALTGISVATSGDWRRQFIWNGRRYSHTINPVTREPVRTRLAQVSVLHDSCMQADAICTALQVMGDEAEAFATTKDIAACFLWREADRWRETLSPALAALLDD
ncbi:FAD:protein FMN transferase [Phenylobacterium immobile]|uniref:FAD:protein FMN transferase n=1 Tax=Phenylobacterium immobile TaxID=21 RepID=UPI000B87E9A9|nr:FAD:protein FMN transferase [Phenylobacterium immobile]